MSKDKRVKINNIPSKTYVNILEGDKTPVNNTMMIVIAVILILALAIFAKFGIIDRISEVSKARNTYNETVDRIEELKASNEDYEQVQDDYSRYGNGYLTTDEIMQVDRLEVLELLDTYVLSRANASQIVIQGNNISLVISDTALSSVSTIVSDLESSPRVSYVTVSMAGTQGSGAQVVRASMLIELKSNGDLVSGETAAAANESEEE